MTEVKDDFEAWLEQECAAAVEKITKSIQADFRHEGKIMQSWGSSSREQRDEAREQYQGTIDESANRPLREKATALVTEMRDWAFRFIDEGNYSNFNKYEATGKLVEAFSELGQREIDRYGKLEKGERAQLTINFLNDFAEGRLSGKHALAEEIKKATPENVNVGR